MNEGKWKKSWEIKLGLRVILEQGDNGDLHYLILCCILYSHEKQYPLVILDDETKTIKLG